MPDASASPETGAAERGADALIETRMRATLARQRRAQLEQGPPSAAVRVDRIDRAIALLVDHRRELCKALAADYGVRSAAQTLAVDVVSAIEGLKHAKRHLSDWMRPRRVSPNFPLGWLGARAHIHAQPLGVVGNIVPWNFPIYLAFGPLAGVFAAGNRSMMKLSEFVPQLSALVERLIASSFDESELVAFQGGAEVGAAFAALPFDHLFFTGSPAVAKKVMRAAAESLTPVTLELGGKSPVVVGASADLAHAARRIAWGKLLNSGQVCLAPDYVFVPEERASAFIAAFQSAAAAMYPTLAANPDYTSMINESQRRRVQSYVDDARKRGVRVIDVNPGNEDFHAQRERKLMPAILLDPGDDCLVMQNEIFGPLLPVKSYRAIHEVIDYVNAHPRPLALYYFGSDRSEAARVLEATTSGGACVNEVIVHAMQENLPFGGCGNSGMGGYHGEQGFRTFSHSKSVYSAGPKKVDPLFFMRPPYGRALERALAFLVRK
jgi:coniferyl-aldehyde dehydrogenase